MKEKITAILKAIRIYHPLQSSYRSLLEFIKKIYNRYAYTKFKGSGFTCNVCQSSFKKFVNRFPSAENSKAINDNHVIAGYGENILCPHCMSTARERLVLGILKGIELHDKDILHFSPEKNISHYLRRFAAVISADIAPGFYKNTDKNVVAADATQLQYPAAKFDIVIANHIMEHIPDDIAAMKEIYRVLKPGGRAILQVPYSESLSWTLEQPGISNSKQQSALFGQKDHVRIYALGDYMKRLKSVGFNVNKISYEALSHLHINAIQRNECFLQITKPTS